ncbi:hypothetical protein F1D05_29895 [Kribbella qitaiheensis]|uniref:Uncharacterized protein n=1 Tax=Kribbella qitaiheensis TaxID=1544730 RepID=A0A7G6X549_9ACTN|nr:hypothetical protein [Kribbella qitaiheensis]QNE21364.1 hypothetical protein F1D05_29895 [Kribbella qitaiheensis]
MNQVSGARRRLDRSAIALGVGAAASPLLGLGSQTPPRLITLGTIGVIVTLVLAITALAGGYLHVRPLIMAAGAGFVAAAVLQTVQASLGGANTLGGDGSIVALYLGFAVGLLAIGLVPVTSATSAANAETAVNQLGTMPSSGPPTSPTVS